MFCETCIFPIPQVRLVEGDIIDDSGYLCLQNEISRNKCQLLQWMSQSLVVSEVDNLNARIRGLTTALPCRSFAKDDDRSVVAASLYRLRACTLRRLRLAFFLDLNSLLFLALPHPSYKLSRLVECQALWVALLEWDRRRASRDDALNLEVPYDQVSSVQGLATPLAYYASDI